MERREQGPKREKDRGQIERGGQSRDGLEGRREVKEWKGGASRNGRKGEMRRGNVRRGEKGMRGEREELEKGWKVTAEDIQKPRHTHSHIAQKCTLARSSNVRFSPLPIFQQMHQPLKPLSLSISPPLSLSHSLSMSFFLLFCLCLVV